METIQTDQEVDQFIWSFISESRNPQDFVAFCQHAVGRDAGHELALQNAERYWYESESPVLFPHAVAALEALANEGNTSAMFHLGRWYRMGIGVTTSSETGLNWYRRGMDLGDLRCQVNIARYTALSDTLAATRLYQQAIDLGYDIAHCFWADIDKDNKEEHLRLAAQSGDAFAMYCYGYHLVADRPAEERSEHLHWIRRAADAGDTTACIYLAYEYKYPKTDEQPDLQTAEQWLLKGVRLGAIGCIGLLGRDLMGTYENITDEGFKLLQRACILGDPIAQSTLGFQMAWWGKSAEDQKKGVAWLHAAALQDHKIAIFRLGEVWEKGRGTVENLEEAINWYCRGVAMGQADCQAALGALHMNSQISNEDPEKAHELFQLSSLQGNRWGTYLLGSSYALGYGTKKDEKAALECFERGAEDDDPRCTFRLGHAYLFGLGVNKNVGAAIKWLKAAARLDFTEANLYLGMILLYEDDVETNQAEAARWLRKAAKANDRRALRELALLYASGNGVKEDLPEAQRLMARSASLGDTEAKEWLTANCPQKPDWLQKLMGENP